MLEIQFHLEYYGLDIQILPGKIQTLVFNILIPGRGLNNNQVKCTHV